MFADVDYSQPDVRADVIGWGDWLGRELNLSGMRLDAIKHYSEEFLHTFIRQLDRTVGADWFYVGEYWRGDLDVLSGVIKRHEGRISLFDVPLVGNLSRCSIAKKGDLSKIFNGTLAKHHPANAVVRCPSTTTSHQFGLEG